MRHITRFIANNALHVCIDFVHIRNGKATPELILAYYYFFQKMISHNICQQLEVLYPSKKKQYSEKIFMNKNTRSRINRKKRRNYGSWVIHKLRK
jgi:hypothetical protein